MTPRVAGLCNFLNRKCTSQKKKKWNIRWKKILGPSILSLWWYCSVLIANNVYCIHFVEDFGDHAGSVFTWMLSSAYDPFTEVIFGEISMLFAYNNPFWTRCMISTTFAAKILQCCLLNSWSKYELDQSKYDWCQQNRNACWTALRQIYHATTSQLQVSMLEQLSPRGARRSIATKLKKYRLPEAATPIWQCYAQVYDG
jgi:hypothetical protein